MKRYSFIVVALFAATAAVLLLIHLFASPGHEIKEYRYEGVIRDYYMMNMSKALMGVDGEFHFYYKASRNWGFGDEKDFFAWVEDWGEFPA